MFLLLEEVISGSMFVLIEKESMPVHQDSHAEESKTQD